MEQPKKSLVLNLIRSFVIALPAAYFLVNIMGEIGFFWSVILTNMISFVVAVYCLKTLDCFQCLKKIF